MAKIIITLHSDLCAASGSGFGNMIDTDVVMDQLGIPYIPGRRIKGCLRQAAEDLRDYGCALATDEAIEELFGNAQGQAGMLTVDNAFLPGIDGIRKAVLSARNDSSLKNVSSSAKIPDLFTYVRGSTAMENGKAMDGSLRFTRVVSHYSPLNPDQETVFESRVLLSDPSLEELLVRCCQATRHIGSKRNRGLGDVSLKYESTETGPQRMMEASADGRGTGKALLEYRLSLDAPMMVSGIENHIAAISSRAVIGCLASAWLKNHTADDPTFQRLFLSGEVQWQDLTPVSRGVRSVPTPRFLARVKGTETRLVNMLGDLSEEEKRAKKKTLDGSFTCIQETGFDLLTVPISSAYHHSTEKRRQTGTLYVEESLDSGVVYGGAVIVPDDLLEPVTRLIQEADFRFGRSRSAQYGACRLIDRPVARPLEEETVSPLSGETVYALILSDLALYQQGVNICSAETVRKVISEAIGLPADSPKSPDPRSPAADSCVYRDLGGYHQMWQLKKPVSAVVCAGSYYRFVGNGKSLPREIRLGEYPQEGMGRIRLMTESELKRKTLILSVVPDSFQESDQPSAAMYTALLVRAAEEELKSNALKYVELNPELRKKVQIGRLRLMLAESAHLPDLLRRVANIKTESYRNASLRLLRDLYARDIPTKLDPDREPIPRSEPDPNVMLATRPSLLKLIHENPEARRQISAGWKKYLSAVLSLAYYQERKEDAKDAEAVL